MVGYEVNLIYTLQDNVSSAASSMQRSMGDMSKITNETSSSLDGLARAAEFASGVLMSQFIGSITDSISESMELAGSFESLNSSFEAMKTDLGAANVSLEDLRSATRGTVADVDLLAAANKAMSLGLPTENLAEMMGAAMKLGRVMGIDTKSAVDSLTTGVGRQSAMILDNLGVTFKAQEAYDWYAESIGKTSDQLTESEKKLGWQQYAIQQVVERAENLGDVQSSVKDSQEQWNASLTNAQTALGGMLGPLGQLKGAFDIIAPAIGSLAAAILPNLIKQFGLAGAASHILSTGFHAIGAGIKFMLSHPILIVITAIIAALVAAYNACPPFRDAINGIAQVLGGALSAAIGAVKAALEWLWNNVFVPFGQWLLEVFGPVLNALQAAWQGLSDFFGGIADAVGKWWEDMTRKTEEGSQDQLAAIDKALEKELARIEEHYTELEAAENERFSTALTEYEEYWDAYYEEEQTSLDKVEAKINEHYDKVLSDMNASYDEQIDEVNRFYDEMQAAADEGLAKIREARNAELDDLELNYLLQKQALKESLESQRITKEEFEAAMNTLEENYRSQRSEISENYRIQELQAEKQNKVETEKIATERKNAVNAIEQQRADEARAIETEKNNDLKEAQNQFRQITEQHEENLRKLMTDKANEIKEAVTKADNEKKEILRQNNEEVKNNNQDTWTQISTWIAVKGGEVVGWLSTHWKNTMEALQKWWGDVVEATQGFMNKLGEALSGVWNSVVNFFKGAWKSAIEILQGAWKALEDAVGFFVRGLEWAWNNIFKPVTDFIGGAMKAAWDTLAGGINWVWNNVIKPVFDALSNAYNTILKPIGDAISGIGSALGGVASGISNAFGGAAKSIGNFLGLGAEGAYVTSPSLWVVGEAGEPEVIAPEPKLREIVRAESGGGGGRGDVNIRQLIINIPSTGGMTPQRIVDSVSRGLAEGVRKRSYTNIY